MQILVGTDKNTGKKAPYGTHSDAVQVSAGSSKTTLTAVLAALAEGQVAASDDEVAMGCFGKHLAVIGVGMEKIVGADQTISSSEIGWSTTPANLPLVFTSDNTEVATVDSSGNVTLADAIHNGETAIITAYFAGNDDYLPARLEVEAMVFQEVSPPMPDFGF